MTSYILYHKNSLMTGKALQDALSIPGGQEDPGERLDYLIRWGNRGTMRYKARNVLNSAHACNNAANKLRAFEIMEEHNIPYPKLVDRFDGELLLARTPSHMHSSGAYFVTSQFDFDLAKRIGCNHFLQFVPCKREFRVHVFNKEIIFAYERVCPDQPKSLNIKNDWNEKRLEIRELPEIIVQTSLQVIETMKLDFGAVDIGLSTTGKPVVFEINTAPALVSETDGRVKRLPSFAVYLEKFRRWLGETEPNRVRIANY